MGVPWETALAGVFVSGIIFIIITIFRIREIIINAIPMELKYAAASGIGFFIAFIGLKVQESLEIDSTLVRLGDFLRDQLY